MKKIPPFWYNKLNFEGGQMFFVHHIGWVIVLTLLMTICSGCADKSSQIQEFTRDNFIMDTLIRIRVCASDPELGQKALEEAFAEFTRIGKLTDKFVGKNMPDPETSDVYQVNKSAGIKPVQVSEDTLAMLERSNYFAGLCDGAFDVTVGPIMDIWGFGQTEYRVPSDEELKSKLVLVGYRRMIIDKVQKTVFLPEKGMEIDLGGIAKGYATDMAVRKLRQMGIESAMINAGGNIYALGSQPDGTPWLVGIQDPRDEKKIIALLNVRDTAVVTSGDYKRYFIRDGIRYHHILDPSSGKPSRKAISATIIAPNATDADVLSTVLFVLGSGQGTEFVKQFSNVNAVLVDERRDIAFTEGLTDQIKFIEGAGFSVNFSAGDMPSLFILTGTLMPGYIKN